MTNTNENTIIDDVNLATDVRRFVSKVDVNYLDDGLKDIIFDPRNDNKFLLVTKIIGSKIKISEVKVVDDDLINSMF